MGLFGLSRARRRAAVRLAVFGAVLAMLSGGATAVAVADEKLPGKGDPGAGTTSAYLAAADPVFVARQEALMSFKTWLVELPGIWESGFVESANSAATNSTTLLWAGSSPLQDAARAEAAKRGITLTVKPVRYTRAELTAARDAVWASRKSGQWNGFVVHAVVGTDMSHDGIIVQGHYEGVSKSEEQRRLATASVYARSLSAAVVDVRITAPQVNTTRGNDTAPFNAGGMMRSRPGTIGHCTSGFAIWLNGQDRATTARHCNDTPYTVWDNGNLSYGFQQLVVPGSGAAVLTSRGYFWMFDGAWNDPNSYHKTVVGYADLSEGDWICTSGAVSGVHCEIEVQNLLHAHDDGQGVFWTISARQLGNGVAVAQGDSGGPVLVPYSTNGWTTVGAAGMNQWGTETRACGSVRTSTTCFNWVGFTSMRTMVEEIGPSASLRTG